jgi:hypothetical protein
MESTGSQFLQTATRRPFFSFASLLTLMSLVQGHPEAPASRGDQRRLVRKNGLPSLKVPGLLVGSFEIAYLALTLDGCFSRSVWLIRCRASNSGSILSAVALPQHGAASEHLWGPSFSKV